MWFKIHTFIVFLFKSKSKHGVHSPFVYELITKCLRLNTNLEKHSNFIKIRNYFLSNKQKIEVTDFGQGSSYFKSNKRRISDIAKIAGIKIKNANTLINIVEYFQPTNILEIGTSLGLATAAIHLGNTTSKITTLEGCTQTSLVANTMFSKFNLNNINLIEGNFSSTLKTVLNKKYDLIYFDGNHNKEATSTYFKQCLPFIHNNSIFIFDDINWSPSMQNAWEEIKKNEQVTVTINTYYWGIVFFRKEQEKQHFTIRV